MATRNPFDAYREAWLRVAAPELGSSRHFVSRGPLGEIEGILHREDAVASEDDAEVREKFQRATEVVTDYREELIRSFPLVTAVAASLKYVNGEVSRRDPCITFFVAEKISMGKRGIPVEIEGVPTDVIESGTPVMFASTPHTPGKRIRPAQPGTSVSHFSVPSGTFGCLVTDGARDYVLSCSHVLSHATGAAGDSIVQPGTSSGGVAPADQIADLTKTILGTGPFIADAAMAEVNDSLNVTADIRGIGKPIGMRTLSGVGLTVQKSGDITGVTHGVVVGINGTVGPLQINGFANVYFNDVIITTGMSQPGDSGSILMDYRNQAIGVLFAGLQFGSSYVVSWFSPIETVLNNLGVSLVV